MRQRTKQTNENERDRRTIVRQRRIGRMRTKENKTRRKQDSLDKEQDERTRRRETKARCETKTKRTDES